MADREESYAGRKLVQGAEGEIAYYDPTEAVEEYAQRGTKSLGGLTVDEGEALPQDEHGQTAANSSGKVVAVPMRGQEEVFAHLDFPVTLNVPASDADEAMGHVRRHLQRRGFSPRDFLSFNVTSHYYMAPLGKRLCGWSFSFESKPFSVAHR